MKKLTTDEFDKLNLKVVKSKKVKKPSPKPPPKLDPYISKSLEELLNAQREQSANMVLMLKRELGKSQNKELSPSILKMVEDLLLFQREHNSNVMILLEKHIKVKPSKSVNQELPKSLEKLLKFHQIQTAEMLLLLKNHLAREPLPAQVVVDFPSPKKKRWSFDVERTELGFRFDGGEV